MRETRVRKHVLASTATTRVRNLNKSKQGFALVKKQTLRRVSVVILSDCDSWCNWARWYISIRVVEVSCRKRYGGGDLSHPRHTYNTRSERYAKTGDVTDMHER